MEHNYVLDLGFSQGKGAIAERQRRVVCLNKEFESDSDRRDYFRTQLTNALADVESQLAGRVASSASDVAEILSQIKHWPLGHRDQILRLAERMLEPDKSGDLLNRWRAAIGFPNGDLQRIVDLSDPPYFTACPNPFIAEIVRAFGTTFDERSSYQRDPHVSELRATERQAVYWFHPYHTKVPPDVIRGLIEHYTDKGALILDAFCGSGMTGVAARESGRNAIVADLSPIATFISGVNCTSHDWEQAVQTLRQIMDKSKAIWGHLYRTTDSQTNLEVNYFVWSDLFTCPDCSFVFPFFPHGVVHHGNKVETRDFFPCPSCGQELNVRRVKRILASGEKARALVWVNAGSGSERVNRKPTKADLALAAQVEAMTPDDWFPTDQINIAGYSAKLAQLGDKGITDVSKFLSKRNLIIFADLWSRVAKLPSDANRNLCFATLTSMFTVISERQGYFGGGGGMSGNFYMPIVRMEKNVYDTLQRKLSRVVDAERAKSNVAGHAFVSTQTATDLAGIPDSSIDYVYTDPPFGANIIYSELNLILEAWLQTTTADQTEAVIDSARNRTAEDYGALMLQAFSEYYRVLKPGRWITVEFHNTMADVWNIIQTSLGNCGFLIGEVGVLDKGTTTILGDIRPGSAKHDLLISAYKPERELEEKFALRAGTLAAVWDFVEAHLRHLPVVPVKDGKSEQIAERQDRFLFDRMLAFHLRRGVSVPISAADFYVELERRFRKYDGMYFLEDQLAEYQSALGAEATSATDTLRSAQTVS